MNPVYDLTIDGVHTYYVLAGGTSVLVYNCGEGVPAGAANPQAQRGLRQVRLTDADLAHPRQDPHINFETYSSPIGTGVRGGRPVSNIHIFLPEESGWHHP
ncbi:hypothetical protein [Saccharothrix sp. NRRL B-16314]|uniref:hypothetical protein n=1 Tax=Saccharothrix sp. NRRL B-16314 TaxID=1463825 RepID=UPI00052417F0|nr:hypothetical protein [Saccharothrix sp. NRRL B-16314]